MLFDIATGFIKSKFLHFLDTDGRIKTSYIPVHKINTKTDAVSGKENELIIVKDVDALAYFNVDVTTATAFDTLVSNGSVRVINDGKAI